MTQVDIKAVYIKNAVDERHSVAIKRDLMLAMYSQFPRSMMMTSLIGATFVVAFFEKARAIVVPWFGMFLCVQLYNLYRRHHLRYVAGHEPASATWDPDLALHSTSVSALINGAAFGAAGWLFCDPSFGMLVWFTIIMICGIAASSIHLYAYHPRAMLCFLFTLTLPLAVGMSTYPSPARWLSCGTFSVFVYAVVMYGLHQARVIRDSMRIRYENVELIAQLETQARALIEANQVKSRFFAAASHDLRQPLHALSYYLSLLQPNDHDQPHVERIEQCVGALDDLLEGVLDIARLDAGRVQPRRRTVDLATHVRKLGGLYGGAAAAKGLTLKIHLQKTRSAADTDDQLLERVLANLINNAIRYTRTGGILLAVRPRGAHWGIAVIDTGVGIAPESLHSVFDEFVQLGNQERDTTQGVGLGLATVKRICTLLDHPLTIRSKLHRGSWLEVRVPRADPASIESAAPVVDHTGELKGCLLLVEDNELVSESLSKVLVSWGLACDVAANGEQALRLANAHRYDAVLCDWRLPGDMNGCELLKHLEHIRPQLRLRVLLTGERDDSIVDLPEGVPLLRKPIRPIRLRALLSAYLLAKAS